jgi:hypothetical protein
MSVWCCVATGPSLVQEDVDALQGRVRVLAINDAYRMAPWADALYAADLTWWHVHHPLAKVDFEGRMYTIETKKDRTNPRIGAQLYGLKVYKQEADRDLYHNGLSNEPGVLRLGGLSGYQGINLVKHWGATVVLLLGYDLQRTGGKSHYFGDHQKGLTICRNYGKYIENFETLRQGNHGLQIINCSRETALECFERMTIHEALERCAA